MSIIFKNLLKRNRGATQDGNSLIPDDLSLSHLRRIHREYTILQDDTEKEAILRRICPLFCKVFDIHLLTNSPTAVSDKLGDVGGLAAHIVTYLAEQVKYCLGAEGWKEPHSPDRISSHADAAQSNEKYFYTNWEKDCLKLAKYLTSYEGLVIIKSLQIMVISATKCIEAMCSKGVATTVLKIVDAFYSLPLLVLLDSDNESSINSDTPEVNDNERDTSLDASNIQNINDGTTNAKSHTSSITVKMTQVSEIILNICNSLFHYPEVLKEIIQFDQMSRLFSSINTPCPEHNLKWQAISTSCLVSISSHCMCQEFIYYVNSRKLIRLYLHNLKHQDMKVPKIVQCFYTLFQILRDSSRVSNQLLEDFRFAQGYKFIIEFILSIETDSIINGHVMSDLNEMFKIISGFVYCGFSKLTPEPIDNDDPWQINGFKVPAPKSTGRTVRNRTSATTLYSIFKSAKTDSLCLLVLDTLYNIFQSDFANYFILKEDQIVCNCLETCTSKSLPIQAKLFELIEFLIVKLSYVPYGELFSICLLFEQTNYRSLILIFENLIKFCSSMPHLQSVYRNCGIIEYINSSLDKYLSSLRNEFSVQKADSSILPMVPEAITSDQEQYIFLIFETSRVIIDGNSENAKLFRTKGGSRILFDLLHFPTTRRATLRMLQVIIVLEGGRDELNSLLTIINTVSPQALPFKIDILTSINKVLAFEPRVKGIFREVGGFLHVISVLTLLDGSLRQPPTFPWTVDCHEDVLRLVRVAFTTFSIVMSDEPSNKHTFVTEIGFSALASTLALLGCFSRDQDTISNLKIDITPAKEDSTEFAQYNSSRGRSESTAFDSFNLEFSILPHPKELLPRDSSILACAECFKHLKDFAMNTFDQHSTSLLSEDYSKRFRELSTIDSKHLSIDHPGALIAIVKLLPQIPFDPRNASYDKNLPSYLTESINRSESLSIWDLTIEARWGLYLISSAIHQIYIIMSNERNQQLMCQENLATALLKHCGPALADESHPLHSPLQRSFEKLASHHLSITDLRSYLRLGNPLSCKLHNLYKNIVPDRSLLFHDFYKPLDSTQQYQLTTPTSSLSTPAYFDIQLENYEKPYGGSISLNRMQSIVAISTPRDAGIKKLDCSIPFIEMNFGLDGFAGVYLPSIFPQQLAPASLQGQMVNPNHPTLIGGTGIGERTFPPVSGLTFSCWIQIVNFNDCINLCTLKRAFQTDEGRQNSICLQIHINCENRTLFVSTKEIYIPNSTTQRSSRQSLKESTLKSSDVIFKFGQLVEVGQWHHIVVVITRTKIGVRSGSVLLYVDGCHIQSQKISYFFQTIAMTSIPTMNASPNLVHQFSVSAYIGTYLQQRQTSTLCYRLANVYLFDDHLSKEIISHINLMGQSYCGNFQNTKISENYNKSITHPDITQSIQIVPNRTYDPLISEDRVVFGLHPSVTEIRTLKEISKMFSRADVTSIMSELGLTFEDSSIPISLLLNIAQDLAGPSRGVGGVVIGFRGVRVFEPRQIPSLLTSMGGPNVLLGLVAMADTTELFYAAVKILMYTLTQNSDMEREMEQTGGFLILGMLYKLKAHLLNSHIIHLTCGLVGTVETQLGHAKPINLTSFQELLGNIAIWSECPEDVQRSLFTHLHELLITKNDDTLRLIKKMRTMKLFFSLLQRIICPELPAQTINAILSLLASILITQPTPSDIKTLGLFLASLLTSKESGIDENNEVPNLDEIESERGFTDSFSPLAPQPLNRSHHDETNNMTINASLIGNQYVSLIRKIRIRDLLMDMLCSLIQQDIAKDNATCTDIIFKYLGLNWIFIFLQTHIHNTTVFRTLKLLQILLLNDRILQYFISGHHGGDLLKDATNIPVTSSYEIVDINLSQQPQIPSITSPNTKSSTWFTESHSVDNPGFEILQTLLLKFTHFQPMYLVLFALLLNQNSPNISSTSLLNLEMLDYLFHIETQKNTTNICFEAVFLVLNLCRVLIQQQTGILQSSKRIELANTILRFLQNLYNHVPIFATLCRKQPFIEHLVAILFPIQNIYLNNERGNSQFSGKNSEIVEKPLYNEIPDEKFFDVGEFILIAPDCDDQDNIISTVQESALVTHPTLLPVLKFLEMIVSDSFKTTSPKTGGATLLDYVIESTPSNAKHVDATQYQVSILMRLMNYIIQSEIIVFSNKDHISLEVYTNVVENVGHFANKLMDKVWLGHIDLTANQVYSDLIKIIEQSKSSSKIPNMLPIYTSLDRTILYQLSRPTFTNKDRYAMVESLCLFISHTAIIFSNENKPEEFYLCIVYCLIELIRATDTVTLDEKNIISSPTQNIDSNSLDSRPLYTQTLQQVKEAAERIWSKLLETKHEVLEEVFRCQLPIISKYSIQANTMGQISIPPASKTKLADMIDLLSDQAKTAWENYCQRECNKKFDPIISKRTPTKKKRDFSIFTIQRKNFTLNKHLSDDMFDLEYREKLLCWSQAKCTQLAELQLLSEIKFHKNLEYRFGHAISIWKPINNELTRERGLWGPDESNPLMKWKLDSLEGPSRQRKRMQINLNFYNQYAYTSNIVDQKSLKLSSRAPISFDAMLLHFISSKIGVSVPKLVSGQEVNLTIPETMKHSRNFVQSASDILNKRGSSNSSNFQLLGKCMKALDSENPLNFAISKMLDPVDPFSAVNTYPCGRLMGLDMEPGIIFLGKDNLYLIDGYGLSKDVRELVDLNVAESGTYFQVAYEENDLFNQQIASTVVQHKCTKVAYCSVREILKRRFLLRENSLELFCVDGNSYLIVLQQGSLNKILDKLKEFAKSLTDKGEEAVVGITKEDGSSVNEGFSLGLFTSSSERNIINLWERGQISNFQYLMYLNTLAGRSYNDLMQYPVYPWVVVDYDSEELDLNNPETFRDFSKPMGAQTPSRLDQYLQRMGDYEDPSGDKIEPFLYGTPYSSAMIVAAYLIRLEPYTSYFLNLQGGHFDLADRMFNSIKESWLSASALNVPDVKELTPEFFFLPEFLTNSNHFKLGRKQNGNTLNDVILPRWAKGDPLEFIRIHREALECDYVSAHLHEWIDLIFGVRQRGKLAEESKNTFHPWFYEGNVDIDTITDPLTKNLVIGFIKNYGQMPKQLFRRPHKQRKANSLPISYFPTTVLNPSNIGTISAAINTDIILNSIDKPCPIFYHDFANIQPLTQPVKELRGPVGQIVSLEKSMVAVEIGNIILPPTYDKILSYAVHDNSLRIRSVDQDKIIAVFEDLKVGKINVVASADGNRIFTGGVDSVIHVWDIKFQTLRGKPTLNKRVVLSSHTAPITCLTANSSYSLLLSGSEDCSVILWDLNRLQFIRQLEQHLSPITSISINSQTGDILTSSGHKVFYWTVNGQLLARINHYLNLGHRINAIIMTEMCEWDSKNVVITGSTDGIIRVWAMHFERKKIKHKSHYRIQSPDIRNVTPPHIIEDAPLLIENLIQPAYQENHSDLPFIRSNNNNNKNNNNNSNNNNNNNNVDDDDDDNGMNTNNNNADDDCKNNNLPEDFGEVENTNLILNFPEETNSDGLNDESCWMRERKNALCSDSKWQRTITEKAKLTIHTSLLRKDNPDPASITSFAISRDYKKFYVGDAKGRVWQWSVPDTLGGRTDRWINTKKLDNCAECSAKFSVTDRKHHCRNCGMIFCSRCSKFQGDIPEMNIYKPVRLCIKCNQKLHNGAENVLPENALNF